MKCLKHKVIISTRDEEAVIKARNKHLHIGISAESEDMAHVSSKEIEENMGNDYFGLMLLVSNNIVMYCF